MTRTPDTSADTWQLIAGCLRTELAEYGGLLALFTAQQNSLFARDANEVLRLSAAIEQQVRALDQSRRARENAVAAFAQAYDQPVHATLRSLLPLVEAPAVPLLEALMTEINHLLHRVRRTTRHNHILLSRAVEVHQEVLQQLRPGAFTKTYSPVGRVSLASTDAASTLRAAG